MSQTITNLVGNAIAYGERGAPVDIAIEGDGRDVELKVHNHGPPIPAELMPVLFEPFRRGVPEDRSPRGLGLGLYIVQQIVLAHDGSIGVDSTAQDGTTFTLHLPRHHAGRPPARGCRPDLLRRRRYPGNHCRRRARLNDRDIQVAVTRDCRPEFRERIAPSLHSTAVASLCGIAA